MSEWPDFRLFSHDICHVKQIAGCMQYVLRIFSHVWCPERHEISGIQLPTLCASHLIMWFAIYCWNFLVFLHIQFWFIVPHRWAFNIQYREFWQYQYSLSLPVITSIFWAYPISLELTQYLEEGTLVHRCFTEQLPGMLTKLHQPCQCEMLDLDSPPTWTRCSSRTHVVNW